ncbi:MAG TPA: spore coat U domain-containing protein [Gammaproteobacteria bacterium]|jgi:spore coat protein U-like protein
MSKHFTNRSQRANCAAAALLLAALSGHAHAETMNVTATVLEVCELGTITDADFGDLTPGSLVDGTAAGSVQWRCSDNTNASITIDQGLNTDRTMSGPGTDTIAYELYKDAPRTEIWGDTVADDLDVTGTGMASFTTETVYGEVLHDDYVDAAQGAYSDTVTVLIEIN